MFHDSPLVICCVAHRSLFAAGSHRDEGLQFFQCLVWREPCRAAASQQASYQLVQPIQYRVLFPINNVCKLLHCCTDKDLGVALQPFILQQHNAVQAGIGQ